MAKTWDISKAAALKILGKDAEVPDMPAVVFQTQDKFWKAKEEFDKSTAACQATIATNQAACDAMQHVLKDFQDKIDVEDFKLDPKKKEDAQKIDKARKLLSGDMNQLIKVWVDADKTLEDINKHLTQLAKYKQTPPSP